MFIDQHIQSSPQSNFFAISGVGSDVDISDHETSSPNMQFPAHVIPAVRARDPINDEVELASFSTANLSINAAGANMTDELPENPPIIVNGPRLPKPAPKPDENSEIRLQKVRREVSRLEVAYYVLSAVDAVATISCVRRNICRELNPLMGSHPSAFRVIGIKALTGFLMHRNIRNLARKDPYKARSIMRISLSIQAAVTGFTLNTAF